MIVEAVIEDPRGATCRHVYEATSGQWRCYRHPHARSPWPVAYGYLPGTRNPADDDPLDVLVLSTAPLDTGDRLQVRPVGLLRRPDGDHKVLAVDPDDEPYAGVSSLAEVPETDLCRIEAWFREWTSFDGWEDAGRAELLIRELTCPK